MENYLIVFKNTQDALKAEAAFKEMGIVFQVYPTPPQILGSCGISLLVTESEYVAKVSGKIDGILHKDVYRISREGIIKVGMEK